MIIKVNSNVRHNGEDIPKGKVFEAEPGEFQGLINSGAMSVVDGATTVTEAETIVAEQEAVKPEAEEEKAPETQNTWGAQPDKQPEEVKTDAGDGTGDTAGQGDQTTTENTGTNNGPIVPGPAITGEEL